MSRDPPPPPHLVGQEPQLLQEVLRLLQLVPDGGFLHLGAHGLRLLAHGLLQGIGCDDLCFYVN